MRVTFPHMGNIAIALESLLTRLGFEVVPPPPITRRTLELGTRYAPEFVCLPFKVNLGNYIEAIEQGADTILMAGGVGPCRFGYYAHVQHDILREVGYDVGLITLEPKNIVKEVWQKMPQIRKHMNLLQIFSLIKLIVEKMVVLDDLEEQVLKLQARELSPGSCYKLFEEAKELVLHVQTLTELLRIKRKLEHQLQQVPMHDRKDVVRIGIVGEIYTVLEPTINLEMEKRLGRLGAEVYRSMSVSEWTKLHLLFNPAARRHHARVVEAAKPYLTHFVGGHGLESVGNTVLFSRQAIDGVIQVLPLTCMPEIVAQSILPEVSKDLNIPVMTLVLDEHSGEAGVQTRLEAFVDMLRYSRTKDSKAVNV